MRSKGSMQVRSLPQGVLDADVVDHHVPDEVAVTGVDGDAALVEHLRFPVVEDVDVLEAQVLPRDGVPPLRRRR
ncbi:hypothetical protein [Streptomyces regalis]|uniref:hypothetical protein n=1 Tax=Streptomyces regalis TaxID=68262 RepID=UPI000AB70C05|nr:hypothetical protein [Streptomyces regalis]